MIDGSEKRNCWLRFESSQNSHVNIENRNSFTVCSQTNLRGKVNLNLLA